MKTFEALTPEIQYTAGPWIVCSGNARQIFNIECKDDGNDFLPIATLRGSDREANAKLIAAAPDLLEALELLTDSQKGLNLQQWKEATEKAKQAIAKAKGN